MNMATLVETYEVPEVESDSGVVECDAEALALIEQLGLKGQRELTVKRDDGETVRSPYREMTKEEFFVYSMICPQQTDLGQYKAGPIPLRVLQVASHAREHFPHLEVWHMRALPKDPVLVGKKDKYASEAFILARWGEVLEAWPVLIQQAAAIYRDKAKAAALKVKQEADSFLATLADIPDSEIVGRSISLPHAYGWE